MISLKQLISIKKTNRIVDVGSELRTFANDTESKDMCRVGAAEDPTMDGNDLSTNIGPATGNAGYDANGKPIYRNKFSVNNKSQ